VFVLGLIINFSFKSKGIFSFSQRDLKIKEKTQPLTAFAQNTGIAGFA